MTEENKPTVEERLTALEREMQEQKLKNLTPEESRQLFQALSKTADEVNRKASLARLDVFRR